MVSLTTVEVPGFGEAVRKERALRDRAFLGGNEIVAGIVVRQLSLRTVLYLEHAENGFVIPYRFDDDVEVLAHAIQVLYFSRPDWKAPEVRPAPTIWESFATGVRNHRFQVKVLRAAAPPEICREVRSWLDDAFMDCPAGSSGEIPKPSYASHPAHLVDLFAAASLPFSFDDIMDMPLKRLWQHWRLAANRVYEVSLTNPSDEIAVAHLGGRK